MKGWRTLLVNGGTVAAIALLGWAAEVNWGDHVSAGTAAVIVAVVNIGLRLVTTGPVGRA
ncbi:MAG TPA: hypothetical protein VM434_20350 [Beijerinckiaceae bacterium]|nr:hypothetical protein [Beijerinckiaceae bacterium]